MKAAAREALCGIAALATQCDAAAKLTPMISQIWRMSNLCLELPITAFYA
jgi:hypothetical protein